MGQCPICQKALIGRQKSACSARHRAEVSKRKKLAAARVPLEAALRGLVGRLEEAAAQAREALAGPGD